MSIMPIFNVDELTEEQYQEELERHIIGSENAGTNFDAHFDQNNVSVVRTTLA